MSKIKKLEIENAIISITTINEDDFICLTDMAKAKKGDNRTADIIKNWIRTRTTIEFLGTWEMLYNPIFNVVEFAHFKSEAGLPTFVLSPKQWNPANRNLDKKINRHLKLLKELGVALEIKKNVA